MLSTGRDVHVVEDDIIADDLRARMVALREIRFHEEMMQKPCGIDMERPSSFGARISSSVGYWMLVVSALDAQRPVLRNVASGFEAPRPPPDLLIFLEIAHGMALHQSMFPEVQ